MMIRLILLALAIFLSLVLFVSEFNKRQKITISLIALTLTIFALWFEQSGQTPKDNLIAANEITDCGVSAEYSYRTNYNVAFCVKNTSSRATATRLNIDFLALDCRAGDCEKIQLVNKEVRLSLAPGELITLKENLDFNEIDGPNENIVWSLKIVDVKAFL